MVWSLSVLAGLLALGVLLGAVTVYFLWQERPKAGSTALAVTVGAFILWLGGQTLVLANSTRPIQLAGYTATVLGIAVVPFAWLAFGLQYTGRIERLSRPQVAGLSVPPAVMGALTLSNASHGLVFADVSALLASAPVTAGFGPVLWGYIAVGYVAMWTADYFLVRKFLASRNVYRKRTLWFLILNVTLGLGHLSTLSGLSPLPHLTTLPVLYVAMSVFSLLIFLGYQSLEFLPLQRVLSLLGRHSKQLAPVARDTVIEEMGSGMLVFDHRNRVVDINPMGRKIVGGEDRRVVGKDLEEVIPTELIISDHEDLYDPSVTHGEYSGVWVQSATGEPRCYDIVLSPLELDDEDVAGRVAIIHDATERERRKQKLEARTSELERQNEQLENFAQIVSHDLRNPLNVAKGSLDLLEMEDDPTMFDRIRQAHERMEAIIDDVLTLARQGKTVDETESLSVSTIANHAWEHVDAPEASLTVTVDRTVEADRGRLMQVFENLFRNAVEHGREDVDITVGPLEDGFFVEDDGPGIPEDDREQVLDQGFTTSETGTGFGLSIVSTVVEAHGWDIEVTEGTEGGARFEITGEAFGRDTERPPRQVAD